MGFFDGGFKGIVGGVGSMLSGGLGLLGNSMENSYNEAAAARDRDFQREVYQNQYQWKAADAKKAGLHPLAVLGSGTYSASPSSVPSADFSRSLGKLGEGIGDTFAGFMTKDEVQEEKDRARRQDDLDARVKEAQIQEIAARAMESAKRAMSYNNPLASGRERIQGQVDSGGYSRTGRAADNTYAVRPMGDGYYDINFSSDYQQEIGDELGQLVNALKSYTRAGVVPFFRDGNTWRNPETGKMYMYDSGRGYWKQLGWTE